MNRYLHGVLILTLLFLVGVATAVPASAQRVRRFQGGQAGVRGLSTEERRIVTEALSHVDDGSRPGYPGKWGTRFSNNEGLLPRATDNGGRIAYREYYLPKAQGDTTRWGARRLIVGGGHAYFTRDHYRSFTRVR